MYSFCKKNSIPKYFVINSDFRWAFWSCVLLQLWVRPATGHLLPAPIAYYIIKQVSNFTGFTQFLLSKTKSLQRLVWKWIEDRYDIIFPPPLLFLLNISYSVERKIIQGKRVVWIQAQIELAHQEETT